MSMIRFTSASTKAGVWVDPEEVTALYPSLGDPGCTVVHHRAAPVVVQGTPDEVHATLFPRLVLDDVPSVSTANASEAFSGVRS